MTSRKGNYLIVTLETKGISISFPKSSLKKFIHFHTLQITDQIPTSNEIISSTPPSAATTFDGEFIYRLILPAFIGIIKFSPGFLVFVKNRKSVLDEDINTDSTNSADDNHAGDTRDCQMLSQKIYKVERSLIIPLVFEEALKVFEKYQYLNLGHDGNIGAEEEEQYSPLYENDPLSSEDADCYNVSEPNSKKEEEEEEFTKFQDELDQIVQDSKIRSEVAQSNADNITSNFSPVRETNGGFENEENSLFFSKMGIYIKNSKTDPVLGLNRKNTDEVRLSRSTTLDEPEDRENGNLKSLMDFLTKNKILMGENGEVEEDSQDEVNMDITYPEQNQQSTLLEAEDDLRYTDEVPIIVALDRTITITKSKSKSLSYQALSDNQTISSKHQKITKKLVLAIRKFFDRGSFYYSYDLDLTRPLELSRNDEDIGKGLSLGPKIPKDLKDVKSAFFFNRYLINDFIDAEFAIPVIQGYIGSFDIESMRTSSTGEEYAGKIFLISQRSTKRCGVRYLRRGIDDEGNVANFVETNQYVLTKKKNSSDVSHFARYTIVRGSIPIFFKQDPSKLSPIPYPLRSKEQNNEKFTLHFDRLKEHYKNITCISLIEKSPKEKEVGNLFQSLSEKNGIEFAWFDFHHMCRKMRYENIELLLRQSVENCCLDHDATHNDEGLTIADKIENYNWYEPDANRTQSGIMRVNCIDCLDRTNVASKFLCSRILRSQLDSWELSIDDNSFSFKYNNIWANNGDSISRQYTSTNALKGDFTRLEKRNYQGLINDAILTLLRYYYGYISDFFQQILIDYLLGNYGENLLQILEEFESNLSNFDPNLISETLITENLIFSRIKQELFDQESVIVKKNEFVLDHWFLSSTFEVNSSKVTRLKPILMILTNKFIYLIDYQDERISHYYKIKIDAVMKLQYGIYISNSFKSFEKNPRRNIGMKFYFRDYEHIDRASEASYSGLDDETIAASSTTLQTSLPSRTLQRGNTSGSSGSSSANGDSLNNLSVKFPQNFGYKRIKSALKLISKTCFSAEFVHEDISTEIEAKRDTSVYNYLSYKIKKMVWT